MLTASVEGYTASLAVEVMLTPGSVQIVTGDRPARARRARKLPVPVQVQVVSHSGKPVPNAEVSFTPTLTKGRAEPAKVATDKNGRARSIWTLGAIAGPAGAVS